MPTWTSLRGWDDDGDPSALDRATRALARAGVTTQRVGATLERVGLRDAALRVVPDGLVRAGSERVDFPASRAYARSRVECGVRINLAGREPSGVVPPDEYEAVRDRLIEGLSAVERPGGGPVFERVARAEEVYEGPYVEETVDVVTVPAGFEVSLTTWLLDDPFDHPTGATWGHHRDGMLVAAGEGVEAGAGAGDPDLFDVAPTALATLGVPASDRMDGAPLPFVDHPGTASYPPVERAAEATDDERVAERLSDLGYLE
jgi:predicted AlkP superfamily phosphohydrolase/phosphomutase